MRSSRHYQPSLPIAVLGLFVVPLMLINIIPPVVAFLLRLVGIQ